MNVFIDDQLTRCYEHEMWAWRDNVIFLAEVKTSKINQETKVIQAQNLYV